MNKLFTLVSVAALGLALYVPASAQRASAPVPAQGGPPPYSIPPKLPEGSLLPANVRIPATVTSNAWSPQIEPPVVAAVATMDTVLGQYDTQVQAMLNHTQRIDFAAARRHADYFSETPMTKANVDGYMAYLSQRLHLDPDQQAELRNIEEHFLVDLTPLYTAYVNAVDRAVAMHRIEMATARGTQPIAVPPPSLEGAPSPADDRSAPAPLKRTNDRGGR